MKMLFQPTCDQGECQEPRAYRVERVYWGQRTVAHECRAHSCDMGGAWFMKASPLKRAA